MNDANKALEAFVENNIPVTRDGFVRKIRAQFLRREFSGIGDHYLSAGKIATKPVFGGDEAADKPSLPLLISYIMLMKYEANLVPELIIRMEKLLKAEKCDT